MKPPTERIALERVTERLAELLDLTPADARIREAPPVDAMIELGGFVFAVEWKGSGSLPVIAKAVQQIRTNVAELDEPAVPVVAVPFMGPVGREHCRQENVGWLDLSGNARIFDRGLRIRIEGQPNLYKRPGRPSSAFAPKSSRIARWLLLHPTESMTQREIARATSMGEGYTSRIVAKLEVDGLILRESDGEVRVRDPDLLLEAWREDYDFFQHEIVRGHVAARSGGVLLDRLADKLSDERVEHAATGLAAAWLLDRFAEFRIVSLYVQEPPPQHMLEDLGFRRNAPGENVWFVVPNDEGVFHGAGIQDGVRCAHPVQVFLDLKAHPERADEAASWLRPKLFVRKGDEG